MSQDPTEKHISDVGILNKNYYIFETELSVGIFALW